jgi:mRNA interferase HigB
MHIICKNRLKSFWSKHPDSENSLLSWYKIAKKSNWKDFTDVRKSFGRADMFKDCVIFDIGGNKFRLITKIRYKQKRIYIRFVLTHSDYDKNSWKEDCECRNDVKV